MLPPGRGFSKRSTREFQHLTRRLLTRPPHDRQARSTRVDESLPPIKLLPNQTPFDR